MQDVIIVGGGAAGLSAAIFSCRRGLRTLLLAKDIGGQTASTAEIENYPGVGRVEGPVLISRFLAEANEYGLEATCAEVTGIEKKDDGFSVSTARESYESTALILAFGKTPRDIGAPGEREFAGRGVLYANLSDTEHLRGKNVAVIGGGNSALTTVLALAPVASNVFLIHRRPELTGERVLLDRLALAQTIVTLTPFVVSEIRGMTRVESLLLRNSETNETKELAVDTVIPCLGFEPRSAFLNGIVEMDDAGRIIVTPKCETSVPGLFAAGDITTVPYQQIVVSAGEGAKAALSAYHYVLERQGKRAARVDWGYLK